MYQFDYDDHCLLPESTKGVLHLTVQNVGVELSQFRRHVVVDDDFSKPITKSKLVSQPRFPGAHILDALPAGTKVPRVVLAAPRQPFFNVLIRQPVADSKDGQASEVTILLQCARSESRQKPSDKRTLWVGDFDASVRKFQKSSAAAASRSGTGSPRRREPCDDKSSSRDDEDTDESSHLASDPWASSGRLQVCIAAQSLSACSLPAARARSHFRRVSVLPLDLAALKIIYGPTIARSHAFAVHPDHSEEELAHASRGRYEFAQLQRIYDFRQ